MQQEMDQSKVLILQNVTLCIKLLTVHTAVVCCDSDVQSVKNLSFWA